jgi:hypothetical protein
MGFVKRFREKKRFFLDFFPKKALNSGFLWETPTDTFLSQKNHRFLTNNA